MVVLPIKPLKVASNYEVQLMVEMQHLVVTMPTLKKRVMWAG